MTWLLNHLWYVHPKVTLTVQATPSECLRSISDAAKPSIHRLQLRNLFMEGRRYHLSPLKGGFRMTSNSKIPWRRRGRTSVAAVMFAEFSPVSDGVTRISLRARMRFFYFADIFIIPLFVTSILVFAPWPAPLIAALAIVLFGLSWSWHRLTATIQATDIIYFVQKALEEVAPDDAPQLAAGEPEFITTNYNFGQEWQKFYQEHQGDA